MSALSASAQRSWWSRSIHVSCESCSFLYVMGFVLPVLNVLRRSENMAGMSSMGVYAAMVVVSGQVVGQLSGLGNGHACDRCNKQALDPSEPMTHTVHQCIANVGQTYSSSTALVSQVIQELAQIQSCVNVYRVAASNIRRDILVQYLFEPNCSTRVRLIFKFDFKLPQLRPNRTGHLA